MDHRKNIERLCATLLTCARDQRLPDIVRSDSLEHVSALLHESSMHLVPEDLEEVVDQLVELLNDPNDLIRDTTYSQCQNILEKVKLAPYEAHRLQEEMRFFETVETHDTHVLVRH